MDNPLVISVKLESLKYFMKTYNVDIIGGLLALEKNNEFENCTTGKTLDSVEWASHSTG